MLTVDFDYFDLHADQVCLDLGCGEGRHALTAHLSDGVQVLGVDLSHSDLKTAVSRIDDMASYSPAGQVLFLQSDGGRLPLADNSVDRLICSEVLEHIPNYIQFLEEIDRVLKPSGRLCISVPRAWPEWVCWTLCDAYRRTPGGHIRIFDSLHLRREVERYGLKCTRRRGAHALHVPYWWLKCCFWHWQKEPAIVRWYHRLLVWDLMSRPWITRWLDRIMNPWMGKSVVMYFDRIEPSDTVE